MTDILMPCYNYTESAKQSINSVLENTAEVNLIIVRSKRTLEENLNEFMKRELTDPFVKMDDDTMVLPGWLDALKKQMVEGVGIVGPFIRDWEGTPQSVSNNDWEGPHHSISGSIMLLRNIGFTFPKIWGKNMMNDVITCYEYIKKGYSVITTWDTQVFHKNNQTEYEQGSLGGTEEIWKAYPQDGIMDKVKLQRESWKKAR